MSGINLQELDASDMLDVLHYLMEEEMIRQHHNGADIPGAVRDYLYWELYGVRYPYYTPRGGRRYSSAADGTELLDDPLEDVTPFNPQDGKAQPVKAYVPPTEVDPDAPNPFGSALDAPLA